MGELDGPNPESLCSQEAVRFGVESRARLHPHSALPAVCYLALISSPLLPGLLRCISEDSKDSLALLRWQRRNHVAKFRHVQHFIPDPDSQAYGKDGELDLSWGTVGRRGP